VWEISKQEPAAERRSNGHELAVRVAARPGRMIATIRRMNANRRAGEANEKSDRGRENPRLKPGLPSRDRRQAQWSLFLSHFDINMTHCLGKSSTKPDLLLRCLDHKEGVENDNDCYEYGRPPFIFSLPSLSQSLYALDPALLNLTRCMYIRPMADISPPLVPSTLAPRVVPYDCLPLGMFPI